MKLLPLIILAMVMVNFCAMASRMTPRGDLVHVVVKTAMKAEGTAIDNHHAIPRPEYDSWSSPGMAMTSGVKKLVHEKIDMYGLCLIM
jgi:hypothetical protein